MPSQYRSTDSLVFGGGLKVKRNVFGRRKTPDELWEVVRKYVRRHGRHKLLRLADQVRTLERNRTEYAAKDVVSQLPRYILESNINLYELSEEYDFKDDFTRTPNVDKRVFYECAVHTALLPFPFGEEEDEAVQGSLSDILSASEKEKKKSGGGFGIGKKKKDKDKSAGSGEGGSSGNDSTMTDVPFDLSLEVLKTRVTAGVIIDLKKRTKAVLSQLQKRTKMYPEEELLAKCLGTYYDNILEKSGKRLEGRRIYDLVRVFMKTVNEAMSSEKAKTKEAKEKFCWQYFEKLIREVTDGSSALERTASEAMALAKEAKLDAQGLLEWLKTVMSWNAQEHRQLIERHSEHALSQAIHGFKTRLHYLTTEVSNAAKYASESEFRGWLEGEQAKIRELQGLFVTAHSKGPKYLVTITANRPPSELFLQINGTMALKNEHGWRLGVGESISFGMWDDKDAVGKEKGKSFLGNRQVKFNGGKDVVKFEKGVELTIKTEQAPEFDTDIDHEDAYYMLLDKCLEVDTIYGMGQNGEYTLSRLSDALLYIYSLRWGINDASRFIMQCELLLPKYAARAIGLQPLYLAFQAVAEAEAQGALVFSREEKERWVRVLVALEGICRYNVIGYRQAFPYNTPENELDQMLYMLRMIYESRLFKADKPDTKPWDQELLALVQVGAVQRFNMLHALSNPVVSNMFGRVLEMTKLILEELNTEKTYFLKSFKRCGLDNVAVSMEIYLKYLALEMDYIWQMGRKCWRQRKALPSPLVFTLYDMMKVVTERLASYEELLVWVEISRWFSPFVFLFLDMTGLKSRDIATNAVRLDDFNAISDTVLHSSSILDVFSFFHQTLDWLRKLGWPDRIYLAKFMGRLGGVYCQCIDNYAELLRTKIEQTLTKEVITEEDKRIMCVQLNNIETARSQLNDLHATMEIEKLQEELTAFAATAPDTPTDAVLPALERGISGTFEVKIFAQFLLVPKIYGLAGSAYFAIVHPTTLAILGRCASDQTVDIAISPPAEAVIVELHYANALGDQVVGRTFFNIDDSVEDHDTHEFVSEMLALGKVMTRLKKMGDKVNDIEFHFRRSFRSLKRTVQDALFTKLVTPMMMAELERLLEKYDRHMVKDAAEYGPSPVYRSNPYMLITDEVIGQELNASFDVLGDTLGFLSTHLYEDVLKLFIRKLWRDVVVAMETQVLLSPVRYLTIKQLTVMVNVVDTFKLFLFGDGELVQLKHLDEAPEYKRLMRLIEVFPLPTSELIKRHEASGEAEILAVLKHRAGPEENLFVKRHEEEKWSKLNQQQQGQAA